MTQGPPTLVLTDGDRAAIGPLLDDVRRPDDAERVQ